MTGCFYVFRGVTRSATATDLLRFSANAIADVVEKFFCLIGDKSNLGRLDLARN